MNFFKDIWNSLFDPDLLKVEVTQEDINLGEKINPEKCPVALAIKRTWYRKTGAIIDSISVYRDRFYITTHDSSDDPDQIHYYYTEGELPLKVDEFIAGFDTIDDYIAKPFTFKAKLIA